MTRAPGYYMARFGGFTFDLRTGELRRGRHVVRLAPKPARVLTVLLEAEGTLVSRAAIERAVWGDVPIDLDRSLNFAIREVRRALADRADAPSFVETLPKRGYRFVAPVEWVGADTGPGGAGEVTRPGPRARGTEGDSAPLTGRRWATTLRALGVLAGVLLLVGTTVALSGPVGDWGRETGAVTIAVLPFDEHVPGRSEVPLGFALTDELITRLARLDPSRLSVIAPTSARLAVQGGATDASVSGALGARYLLRGSITGSGVDRRIVVRLVDADDGRVLWTERYIDSAPDEGGFRVRCGVRRGYRAPQAFRARGSRRGGRGPRRPARVAGRTSAASTCWRRTAGQGDAVGRLEAAVAADPRRSEFRVALARGYMRMGRRQEGRSEFLEGAPARSGGSRRPRRPGPGRALRRLGPGTCTAVTSRRPATSIPGTCWCTIRMRTSCRSRAGTGMPFTRSRRRCVWTRSHRWSTGTWGGSTIAPEDSRTPTVGAHERSSSTRRTRLRFPACSTSTSWTEITRVRCRTRSA